MFDSAWNLLPKTAAGTLQEQMQRYLAPIHQVQEMQNLLRRHSYEYQMREVAELYDDPCHSRELLERTYFSKHARDLLNECTIASQAKKLSQQYSSASLFRLDDAVLRRLTGQESILDAIKQYEQYLKPVMQQQEWLNKIHRQALGDISLHDIARQIEQANPALATIAKAKSALDSLWGQFRGVDWSQFEIGEEDEQEAERVVQSIGNLAVTEATIQDAVEKIIAAIQLQQKPYVQLMLWLFFRKVMDWLVAGAIGAAMGHYAPTILGESPQAAKKAVKEIARDVAGATELLSDYRYVSAKVLVVRQNPRARSPEVGRLQFGKPIKVIQKSKDFALVQWTDKESGAEIHGWVFARYLGRFN